MEMEYNLKSWAKFFKFFPRAFEKSAFNSRHFVFSLRIEFIYVLVCLKKMLCMPKANCK